MDETRRAAARAMEDSLLSFISNLRYEALPAASRTAAQAAVLDHLVCAVVGMGQPWVRALQAHATREVGAAAGGRGATVHGLSGRLPPALAARINGTASHGFELDDVYLPGIVHPGAVVVPAVLAAAQDSGADGATVLAAVVAGYEVMGRVGRAVGASHSNLGFHSTGLHGPIGAAAAVANLAGVSAPELANAVGIATSLGSGIKAFQNGPGWVKRLHAGRAAESGVLAAQLAQHGFPGPTHALTNRRGYLEVVSLGAEPNVEALTDGLGQAFVIDDTYIKPYAACAAVHGAVRAAADVRERLGGSLERIDRIVIGSSRRVREQNNIPCPTDGLTAQYSVQFATALGLLDRITDLASYELPAEGPDRDITQLMRRMSVVEDDEAEARYPSAMDCRVTVMLTDGSSLSVYGRADGSTSRGLDVAEEKCARFWPRNSVNDEVWKRVIAAVRALPTSPDVEELLGVLRSDARVRDPAVQPPASSGK